MNPLLIGAAVAYLLAKSTKGTPGDQREADLDALASMLITETGFNRDRNEMAQIVFVAVNRAKKYGKTLEAVVVPPGTPVWNSGAKYKQLFDAARGNARWQAARSFAAQVLAGTSGFKNAGATSFVHPGAMPTPPCASNRVATSTISGTRCVPEWIVGGRVIGGAMFA